MSSKHPISAEPDIILDRITEIDAHSYEIEGSDAAVNAHLTTALERHTVTALTRDMNKPSVTVRLSGKAPA